MSIINESAHLLNVVLNFLDGSNCLAPVSDGHGDVSRRVDEEEEEEEESCVPIKMQSQQFSTRLG